MPEKNVSIAKITRPKLTGIVPRRRLFSLLDTGRNYPVVWLSAPAGSGKTTLAANYLDTRRLPSLWYRVDEGDADIATFFYYMGLAVKRANPRKKKPLPLLTPAYLQNIRLFTKRYFEEICRRIKPPFFIVFDNYQDVAVSSGFHDMIVHGSEEIPKGVNVMIVSREEPPPPFARLRANGRCSLLGWNQIKFTADESKEVVRMKGQKGIPDETIHQLHHATDGWVAGLVLLMEAAKTKGIDYEFLGKIPPEEIFGYFATEIFEKAEKETQKFLLKTACLPSMTAHMAEKLTGVNASAHVLSAQNRNNYFTSMHLQPAPVYQYHPLFREFLLSRARDTFTREEFLVMQKNAAVILEEAGYTEEAAIIFRDTGDWDGLVRLILKYAESLIQHGRLKTLEEWLVSIPGETRGHTPWLLYWYGICRMPHNPAESRNYFDRAFEQFRAQGEHTGMWLSWSYAVDTFFHEFSNFSPLDRYISVFEELYQEGTVFSTPEIEFRVVSCRFFGMMLREQYHPEIEKWAGRTLSLLRECKDANFRLISGYYLAVHYMWVGDFTNAGIVMNVINEGMQTGTILPLERLLWETTKAMYAWLTGDISPCLRIVSDALKLADETGVHIWDHHLLSHGACASLSAGDIETAASLLKKIEPGLAHTRKIEICFYHFLSAWKELIRGNVSSVAEHIKISLDATVEVETYLPIAVARITMSQGFAAMGRYEDAFAQLELAWQIGCRANSNHIKFACLLTEAHFAIDCRAKWYFAPPAQGSRLGEAERTQQEWRGKENSPQRHRGTGERTEKPVSHKDAKISQERTEGGMDKRSLSVLPATTVHAGNSCPPPALQANCPPLAGAQGVDGMEVRAGNNKSGLDALREAMSLGREHGIVNCFGWRPDVMPRLCIKALDAGIEVSYVQRLIRTRHLVPETPPLECENWPWPVRIFTLGRFGILKDEQPLEYSRKAQQRPLLMLKALIALGGRNVAEEHLSDLLWPEADGDAAHKAFEVTLLRLRRLIGHPDAIQLREGQLTLGQRYCWVDAWAFESVERSGTSLLINPPVERSTTSLYKNAEAIRLAEKAIGLYKGHFLPADTGHPWTASYRERLQDKFHRLVIRLSQHREEAGHYEGAIECLRNGVETDNLAEEFYQRLMVCYQRLGQEAEAVKVYHRCRAVFSATLGIAPSARTEAIYKALIKL